MSKSYNIVKEIFNGNPIVYWGISSATGGSYNLHKVCLEKLEFTSPSFFDNATVKRLLDGQNYTLKNVEFPSGSSKLQPLSFEELDKLVTLIKANPQLMVKVTGYTDDIGSASKNEAISKETSRRGRQIPNRRKGWTNIASNL